MYKNWSDIKVAILFISNIISQKLNHSRGIKLYNKMYV